MPRCPLDVPFSEKELAKRNGAQWDPIERRWFDPFGLSVTVARPPLSKWEAKPELPEILAGEDRTFTNYPGMKIYVDMIPEKCWFTNARSAIADADWDRVKRMVTNRAGRQCEACGGPERRDEKVWLEVHERWEYTLTDEPNCLGTQKLKRLICLCTHCHTSTHFGLAELNGFGLDATVHMERVNGISFWEVEDHIETAQMVWHVRNQVTWALDLSILSDAGIRVNLPHLQVDSSRVQSVTLREHELTYGELVALREKMGY